MIKIDFFRVVEPIIGQFFDINYLDMERLNGRRGGGVFTTSFSALFSERFTQQIPQMMHIRTGRFLNSASNLGWLSNQATVLVGPSVKFTRRSVEVIA
ncbi:hypothetical protein [Actinomadura flavalba]|uniref:hypothetical protein n=1 Tax=Actinomadura flavalba TaxID=1120938 RepID=UPI0003725340|nr:hypothetical protein [Actinomadura flavalba]